MILSPKERYNAEHGRDVFSFDRKRGALRFRLWPRGEVVYEIQPQLGKFSVETNCWFSYDITKIQTTKLSILLRFYFHGI